MLGRVGIDPLPLICTLNFTIALHIFLSTAAASTCDMCPSARSKRYVHRLLAGGHQGCGFCIGVAIERAGRRQLWGSRQQWQSSSATEFPCPASRSVCRHLLQPYATPPNFTNKLIIWTKQVKYIHILPAWFRCLWKSNGIGFKK